MHAARLNVNELDKIKILRTVVFFEVKTASVLWSSDHKISHYCILLSRIYKTWLDSTKATEI